METILATDAYCETGSPSFVVSVCNYAYIKKYQVLPTNSVATERKPQMNVS